MTDEEVERLLREMQRERRQRILAGFIIGIILGVLGLLMAAVLAVGHG